MKIERNKNLKKHNIYTIDCLTQYFLEIKKEGDWVKMHEWLKKENIQKIFFLGKGANTIFLSDTKKWTYKGVVVKISNSFMRWKNTYQVEVGAGKEWDIFLQQIQKRGKESKVDNFFDIQSLSSIPGSVGASVFGNIGAFGTEIKRYVRYVKVFDLVLGKFIILDNKQMKFSYRNSFIKKNRERYVIYSVVFDFSPYFQNRMKKIYAEGEYFSFKHFAEKHELGKIKKKELRKHVKRIRRNIYPNIKKFPNVGSTFKNSEITENQYKDISKKYPDIPHWTLKNGKVKIPTAYIFDKILGLNGKRFGNIQIHQNRPLFFMNMGGATGKEFYDLCQSIKEKAYREISVVLEEEVFFVQ